MSKYLVLNDAQATAAFDTQHEVEVYLYEFLKERESAISPDYWIEVIDWRNPEITNGCKWWRVADGYAKQPDAVNYAFFVVEVEA